MDAQKYCDAESLQNPVERIKLHWNNLQYKNWRLVVFFLIVLFLATSFCILRIVEHANMRTANKHFDAVIQVDVSRLRSRFENYADTLYLGRALFLTDKSVTREDWTDFVDSQNLKERYPGVNGLGYVSVIPRTQASELAKQLNTNRLPTETAPVSIFPASSADRLAVLTYLAPIDLNQQAIGYDLYTSPPRTQTLNAARDSGTPKASAPLLLATDKPDAPPSILLAMPIYDPKGVITTVAGRQAALTGFIVLSLHSQPLLDPIFQAPNPYGTIAVTISTNGQIVYQAGSLSSGPRIQKTISIEVAGQTWNLDFAAPSNFGLSTTSRMAPILILWNAALFALLLYIALYYAMRLKSLRRAVAGNSN